MLGQKVKVYFELDSQEWHGGGTESLWAEVVAISTDGIICQLLNSPFYTRQVSYLDTVRARPEKDNGSEFLCEQVVSRSGHSTYMVLTPPISKEFEALWQELEELGCTYESTGVEETVYGRKNLYTIDVPVSVNVEEVYRVLDECEKSGVLMFQEGYFGHRRKGEVDKIVSH